MKFSCEKPVLQDAINTASRAVATKSSIPALEGLLLVCSGGALTVTGYNMQLGIRTRFPVDEEEEGRLVLNAHLLSDIVRRMPDDTLTLSTDEQTTTVKLHCGDADFDIVSLPVEEYPELPEVEENNQVVLPEKTLRAMIEQTRFAVSTNEARPVHMGSLFEILGDMLTVVSVDGFRLALRREKLEASCGAFSFVAPGTALGEVEKICEDVDTTARVTLGDRHILFELGATELICRRLEGEFLDYKNAIPRRNPIKLSVDTKSMVESLDRVGVVISEKLKSPVRCFFQLNRVIFTAKTANGEAKDICRIVGDGRDLEIGFNNRYLSEALRYAPADTVLLELNTGISPAVIVPADGNESFLYMVLPVRLKA